MDNNPIVSLSENESWEFLKSQDVGRLAVNVLGQPEIFPVNYIVVGKDVVFRTAEGTKLLGVVIESRVAFEVDLYGPTSARSVVAKGTARQVEAQSEIDALELERLHPWVPTLKYNFVAIRVDEITGRAFEFGPEPDRFPVM